MNSYAANTIDPKTLKKILIGSVIPRPIALIVTKSEEEIINVAPFSYFNLASYAPPVLMVSLIRNSDGSLKDTARNLLQTRQGVVHIVTEELLEDANQTASPLASNQSELLLTQWTTVPSQQVSPPRIQQASVAFEVETEHISPIKDGNIIVSDVYLLRIKQVHLAEHIYNEKTGYINYQALQPMSRLAGNDYAHLGKITSITRPT